MDHQSANASRVHCFPTDQPSHVPIMDSLKHHRSAWFASRSTEPALSSGSVSGLGSRCHRVPSVASSACSQPGQLSRPSGLDFAPSSKELLGTDAAQLNPLYVLYTRCVGRRQAQAPHARPGGGCCPPALVLGAPAAAGGVLVRGRILARARGSSSCLTGSALLFKQYTKHFRVALLRDRAALMILSSQAPAAHTSRQLGCLGVFV